MQGWIKCSKGQWAAAHMTSHQKETELIGGAQNTEMHVTYEDCYILHRLFSEHLINRTICNHIKYIRYYIETFVNVTGGWAYGGFALLDAY